MTTPESLMQPDPSKPICKEERILYDYLVIDGGGMITTAWTVQRDLESAEDRLRGTIYVFITVLASLSALVKRGGKIILAWDGKDNRRWRRGRHPWYKHGRGSLVNRDEVRVAMAQLDDLLRAMGVCILREDGREADDMVASVTTHLEASTDAHILVFSDDHDYRQLISDRTHLSRRSLDGIVLTPSMANMMGITFGDHYLSAKALHGDPGDNIKGLKQIGEQKALSVLRMSPNIVAECCADPAAVDWSFLEGALRKSFVRAGRRLVWPPDIDDHVFVRMFCQRNNIPPKGDYNVPEERSLQAAAYEIAWTHDLVAMDRTMEFVLEFPIPNFAAIPMIINRLDMGAESDLITPLYVIAGMVAPGQNPHWRSAVRAGDQHSSDDKF